jgi:outer membrane immunogenic protein
MKNLMIAAACGAASLAAAPAFAQSSDMFGINDVSAYGNLGYTFQDGRGLDLSNITGRLGARTRYLGLEGELSGGVGSDHFNSAGTSVRSHLEDAYAGYVVGYLPVLPKLDLLARVGVGENHFKTDQPGTYNSGAMASFNYGAGGQYMFDGHNGVRADYTRTNYYRAGGDADAWTLSYVKKF